jgi:hypothetical protein
MLVAEWFYAGTRRRKNWIEEEVFAMSVFICRRLDLDWPGGSCGHGFSRE